MAGRVVRGSWLRRGLATVASMLLPIVLELMPCACMAQNVIDWFLPDADNTVSALAVQADGKIVAGGAFTSIAGQTRHSVARLNHDGSIDATFADPNLDGAVDALVIQADGKIVVGGEFTHIGAQTRTRVARLNANGTLDATFIDPDADGTIYTIAIQSDGKILIGGAFAHIAGQEHFRIARLNAGGSLDASFTEAVTNSTSSIVWALAVQPDNMIVAAGALPFITGQTLSCVARLHPDGTLDATFVAPVVTQSASPEVYAVALQADGKVIIGGYFDSVAGQPRHSLARLKADGTLDSGFGDPNTIGPVGTLALQPDGRILAGGNFNMIGGQSYMNLARVNQNGTLDTTFRNPGADQAVAALALQADGDIVVGGYFLSMASGGRHHIARLNFDGSLDQVLFGFPQNGQISALAVQNDGRILVGGAFTSFENTVISGPAIARVFSSGVVDAAYDPNPTAASNAAVNALALQPDGKAIVAGYFTAIGGQARNKIARLNIDGNADSDFDATQNPNDFISALAVQPDGKIVVGGPFTYISGQTRNHIARLNADGTLDMAFNPNADSGIGAIAVLPDGRLVVAGSFTKIGGQTRHDVARLNTDGTPDMTFVDPEATGGNVSTLVVQPDGKILVGGFFTMIGGQTQCCIARLSANGTLDATFSANPDNYVDALALQVDGKIVIGGYFNYVSGQFREYLARLNADGGLDMTFTANANNVVLALALQLDGKLIAGGLFTTLSGQPRSEIARLEEPELTLQSLEAVSYTAVQSTVTWTRSGDGPELGEPPQLWSSADGQTYSPVGPMQRVGGGWRYTGLALPLGQDFYLRATGRFSSGSLDGSGGVIEAAVQFFSPQDDGIFADGFD